MTSPEAHQNYPRCGHFKPIGCGVSDPCGQACCKQQVHHHRQEGCLPSERPKKMGHLLREKLSTWHVLEPSTWPVLETHQLHAFLPLVTQQWGKVRNGRCKNAHFTPPLESCSETSHRGVYCIFFLQRTPAPLKAAIRSVNKILQ